MITSKVHNGPIYSTDQMQRKMLCMDSAKVCHLTSRSQKDPSPALFNDITLFFSNKKKNKKHTRRKISQVTTPAISKK